MAAVTVVAICGAIALAFVTIDPPPLKAKTRGSRQAATPEMSQPSTNTTPIPKSQSSAAPAQPAPIQATVSSSSATATAAPQSAATENEKKGDPNAPANLAIETLRTKANSNDTAAMEEMGRRLIQGVGVAKDPQAGAGWLVRAADQGSAQSAFNVGVMYERGFVVERDSTKAAQWYRKAAELGVPMAKHNLALLLREGKGVARDGKAAIELLQSAARQGMAASMFSLGDIYDRGDAAPRDATAALAWFAITGEFERQSNRGEETALARTASQRASVLQRTLTPEELKQAQDLAQAEFKRIVETLTPPAPVQAPAQTAAVQQTPATPEPAAASDLVRPSAPHSNVPDDWPGTAVDQVRAIQQALLELGLLRDKPDGGLGPMTRSAIRAYQKSAGQRETGEPSKALFVALRAAIASRDAVTNSPLPAPPREPRGQAPAPAEPAKAEAPNIGEPARSEPPRQEPTRLQPARLELPRAEPPPPPGTADFARARTPMAAVPATIDPPRPAMPSIDTTKPPPVKIETAAPPPRIDLGQPEPPPPPPTSSDVLKLAARTDSDAWPAARLDQVKAVQQLLRELKFYSGPVDGQAAGGTRTAIREYERLTGAKETGEPSQALFASLKEMRKLMSR